MTTFFCKILLLILREAATEGQQGKCEEIVKHRALFVFFRDGLKQNAGSLLTPVSSTVFDALSNGTLRFAFHVSSNNCLLHRIRLAVEEFPSIRKWFK